MKTTLNFIEEQSEVVAVINVCEDDGTVQFTEKQRFPMDLDNAALETYLDKERGRVTAFFTDKLKPAQEAQALAKPIAQAKAAELQTVLAVEKADTEVPVFVFPEPKPVELTK